MRNVIVGALFVAAGMVFVLFGAQFLGGIISYWAHSGFDIFLWIAFVVLWGFLLSVLTISMAYAIYIVLMTGKDLAQIYIGERKRGCWRGIFPEAVFVSFVTLLFWFLLSTPTRLLDVSVTVWGHTPFFTEEAFDSLIFWYLKAYMYAYPCSMILGGFIILRDAYRKAEEEALSS